MDRTDQTLSPAGESKAIPWESLTGSKPHFAEMSRIAIEGAFKQKLRMGKTWSCGTFRAVPAAKGVNQEELCLKDMSLKPQERKEKWERHPGKKPRESENCVSAEPSENGHNNDAGSSEREAERGKERMKKKLPLKLSKQLCLTHCLGSENKEKTLSGENVIRWNNTAKRIQGPEVRNTQKKSKRGDDDYFITIQENTTLFCQAKEGREEVIAVGVWVLQGLRDQPEVVEPHHPDLSGFGNSTGTSAQS
ncbi:hypothetical protein TURU_141774 [Turdus rufiventris]|nr:hypothetical protein TURU_141774 [Turdus rufiventris]